MEEKRKDSSKKKKNLPKIEITELFLVKSGWNRTFLAEIFRDSTEDGKAINYGTVVVNEGKIWSTGETQDELSNYLDDICTMKLDYSLHDDAGVSTKIAGESFFHN